MAPEFPLLYEWDKVSREQMCNEEKKEHICPPNKEYCSCLYTYEFKLNQVVEFVIVDEGFTFQSNHPMHLHGHRYVVMGIDKVKMKFLFIFFSGIFLLYFVMFLVE